MRAWQMAEVGQFLVIVELEAPTPGAGQAVVDVKAAGLCHSDVGFVDGDLAERLHRRR